MPIQTTKQKYKIGDKFSTIQELISNYILDKGELLGWYAQYLESQLVASRSVHCQAFYVAFLTLLQVASIQLNLIIFFTKCLQLRENAPNLVNESHKSC